MGRNRNLLLDRSQRTLRLSVWRALRWTRRQVIWWRAKCGIHVFLAVIWRDYLPAYGRTKLSISFFLHNAFVKNNNNKWIIHTIPVR